MNYCDMHCDSVVRCFDLRLDLCDNNMQIDLKKRGCGIQTFAVCIEPLKYANALEHTLKYIDFYYTQLNQNKDKAIHINGAKEMEIADAQSKLGCLLSIEGGEPFEGDLSLLRALYKLGVRMASLTWNYRNTLAVGAMEDNFNQGLTPLGIETVLEMERLGMVIDVSHINAGGFWDIERITKKPFVASHSNAAAVSPHKRNLDDRQIRAIAERGGVIGVNLYPPFLNPRGKANGDDLIKHTRHIINVGGNDVIALGADFDGMGDVDFYIKNCEDIEKFICAVEKEFGSTVAEKMFNKNVRRVLSEIL